MKHLATGFFLLSVCLAASPLQAADNVPPADSSSGLSVTYKAREHYGLRLFLDYNLLPSHSRKSGEWMNLLSAGTSFVVML